MDFNRFFFQKLVKNQGTQHGGFPDAPSSTDHTVNTLTPFLRINHQVCFVLVKKPDNFPGCRPFVLDKKRQDLSPHIFVTYFLVNRWSTPC